ncbi:hypothetical protein MMC18_005851 [Xylographa bjoerkii]|nr:hypothetical protein [Xylographa bjoerkii]
MLIFAVFKIAQSDELGPTVDIGANWVHSTVSNPIVDLARETDTPLHLWEHTTCLIDGAGSLVENQKATNTLQRVWDILDKASEYSRLSSKTIDLKSSLYDFFIDQSDQLLHAQEIDEYERSLLLGMAEMWGAYVGDRTEQQSLKFFFLEDCIEGDDLFIATNYQRIIARIAKVPLAQGIIQYRKKVNCVQYRDHGSQTVVVKTSDGQEQEFDEVVVTTPLGWLKHNTDFLDPLTPRLSQAIDSVSFGRLEKVYIRFPNAFWDESSLLPNGKLTEGTLLHGRAPTSTPSPSSRTSFMHWISPSYATASNPKQWRLETVSLAALPEPLCHPTLLFYTFGDCSTYITSLIHGLSGQARYTALDTFFNPYYSRLPNYRPETCRPVKYLATEWCKDELSGYGSYCNFQVGIEDAANDVRCMRHGMPEYHIWLAGEHTAPFDGLGTLSGAYFSGEEVAKRITQIYSDGGTSRRPFS